MNLPEEKPMSKVGLNSKILFPENERFISPNRDLGIIGYSMFKAGLDLATDMCADTQSLCEFAQALGVYCNGTLTENKKLDQLLYEFLEKVNQLPQETQMAAYKGLTLILLFTFGIAQRESTDSKVMNLTELQATITQGAWLSRFSPELRAQLSQKMKMEQEYMKEADRKPLTFKNEK